MNVQFVIEKDINRICPNISAEKDRQQLEKFDGMFQDDASCEEVDNSDYTDELIHRTPGYCGWQQEEWLSHCGDYCTFVGYVGWKELVDLGIVSDLNDDFERYELLDDLSKKQLKKGGSLQGYLFRCVVCGKYRLAVDSD